MGMADAGSNWAQNKTFQLTLSSENVQKVHARPKKVIDEIKSLTGTLPLFNKIYLAVDDS